MSRGEDEYIENGNKSENIAGLPREMGLSVKLAEIYLDELEIPLDCNIHFYNNRNEVTASSNDYVPQERLNIDGRVMGLYKHATQSTYVRVADSYIEMASTLAHEVAHHFLASNSALGSVMADFDVIYEVYKEGSDIEVNTIIGNVSQDNKMLFEISRMSHEGFATWVGHYVLLRFVETMKKSTFNDEGIDVDSLNHLLEGYERLSQDLDGKYPEYYYGRLEYCNIERFFGPFCVPIAALLSMDVSYNLGDLKTIVKANKALLDQPPEILAQNLKALKTSPNLRLIAISRILPTMVCSGDDISKLNDPVYFLNAIRRYLGEDFLETEIKEEDAEFKLKEGTEGSINRDSVTFGKILAEIVYGDGKDLSALVNQFSGVSNEDQAKELVYLLEHFGSEVTKKKANEILQKTSSSDENVRIGEAISKIEYLKDRDEILECLKVLKGFSSDAEKLYKIIYRGEFEGSWQKYLKDLKREIFEDIYNQKIGKK